MTLYSKTENAVSNLWGAFTFASIGAGFGGLAAAVAPFLALGALVEPIGAAVFFGEEMSERKLGTAATAIVASTAVTLGFAALTMGSTFGLELLTNASLSEHVVGHSHYAVDYMLTAIGAGGIAGLVAPFVTNRNDIDSQDTPVVAQVTNAQPTL